MNITDAARILILGGWREYPDQFRRHARCFFKRFETPTRCAGNSDKAGMQVCCAVSEFEVRARFELDLCGELSDGTWIKFDQWSLPAEIDAVLALIPRMIATWEFAASYGKKNGTP